VSGARGGQAQREDATRVLLVSSGLDHARRGYESFARECFGALRDDPSLQLELVKGSGPSGPRERSVPTIRRDGAVAQTLGRALGARPFRIEALAFAASIQPLLMSRRPDLVYLSEWDTARGLAALRRVSRLRFKLLLCNGGFASEGFEHLDHVQELTPAARDYVICRGADPSRHSVLPLGFRIDSRLAPTSPADRQALRERLHLPADRKVVLSVAALNHSHKRLDYLIDELATLPEPRPFLLLAGEPDRETQSLRTLARERLGSEGHEFRTVPVSEVPEFYRASDLHVLASLVEAQGRVLIEAASNGVRCVAHDSGITRFALGEHGIYGDLTRTGTLAGLLAAHLNAPLDLSAARAAHRFVFERFSWKRLHPQYVELLTGVASGDYRPRSDPWRANSTVSSSTAENVLR
jgi:glycosyltransferase involved in cell wall biosynthesis